MTVDTSISIKHAAEALDCHASRVRTLLDRGQLEGHWLGREKRVYEWSIEKYRQEHKITVKMDCPMSPKRKSNSKAYQAAQAVLDGL